jgi:hypothetical protein
MGPAGLLRLGAHNYLPNSHDFDNVTYWGVSNTTIVEASTNGPVFTLTENTANTSHYFGATPAANRFAHALVNYRISLEAKAGTATWIQLTQSQSSAGLNQFANFDLTNGVVGATKGSANVGERIVALGDGWYRCELDYLATGSANNDSFFCILTNNADSARLPTYTGTSQACSVRRARLVRIPSDDTYIQTSTAARYGLPLEWSSAGVLQGLLCEEARTNLIYYSQDVTNAAWTTSVGTKTANYGVAPDGTTTSTRVAISAGSWYAESGAATTNTSTYTVSGWFKRVGGSNQTFRLYFSGNVISGDFTATADWQRFSYTGVSTGSAGGGFTRDTGGAAIDVEVWGMQLELGAFPTSYIPTVASTVTRAADNISLATSAFPYSATTMTVYANLSIANVANANRWIEGGVDGSNYWYCKAADNEHLAVVSGGAVSANIDLGTYTVGANDKIAAAMQADNYAACLNGGTPTTDTAGAMPVGTPTLLYIGRSNLGGVSYNGYIKSFMYLPVRKSDAELVTLTR